jgi:hypothetical protein
MPAIATDARQRGHAPIALVGHDHGSTGLGHQEVGAGDAYVGREEVRTQNPRASRVISATSVLRVAEPFLEQVGTFLVL